MSKLTLAYMANEMRQRASMPDLADTTRELLRSWADALDHIYGEPELYYLPMRDEAASYLLQASRKYGKGSGVHFTIYDRSKRECFSGYVNEGVFYTPFGTHNFAMFEEKLCAMNSPYYLVIRGSVAAEWGVPYHKLLCVDQLLTPAVPQDQKPPSFEQQVLARLAEIVDLLKQSQ